MSRLRVIPGGRPPSRRGEVVLKLPATPETGRTLEVGSIDVLGRDLYAVILNGKFMAAWAACPDISDCYMHIQDGARQLWIENASFDVTPVEFDQIAAVFSPLGLAVFNGPAPDDDDDPDDDPDGEEAPDDDGEEEPDDAQGAA